MRCYACQQINPPTARFCSDCGAALAAGFAEAAPATPSYPPAAYAPLPVVPGVSVDHPAQTSVAPASPAMAGAYAPFPFAPAAPAPAPAPAVAQMTAGPGAFAPSMVNNVTVTQTTPPPVQAAPPPASSQARSGVGALGVMLRALYFLGSGAAVGFLWVASSYSGPYAVVLALVMTIIVLLLNIRLLDGLAHRHP